MNTNKLVSDVVTGSVAIKTHALQAESQFRRAVALEKYFLLHLDTSAVRRFKTAIDTAQIHVWAILNADSTGMDDVRAISTKKKAAELQRLIDRYFRGFGDIVWELSLRSEKRMVSFSDILRTDSTMQKMYTDYTANTIRASVLANEIVLEADASTDIVLKRLYTTQERTLQTIGWLSCCAVLAGFALAYFLAKRFSRSIIELRDAAQKVAAGSRSTRVTVRTGDELGELGTAFNTMVENLASMFRDIEEMFYEVETKSLELASANEQNQALLLNVLPNTIAERLKQGATLIADEYDHATILFADIVGFTRLSTEFPAVQIVEMLNWIFSVYDDLTEQYGLEKIKTIGDSYMVAGGVPVAHPHHCEAVAEMGLAIIRETQAFAAQSGINLNVRVGIHTGHVVAGVIGQKKFIYDLWGDTVNTASRMESSGASGHVHVSEEVYEALRHFPDRFQFQERGEIEVKGKGKMRTYFLNAASNLEEITQ